MGMVKNFILKWLGFRAAIDRHIEIREFLTHENSVLVNRVWYRGDPAELGQLYKMLGAFYGNDSRFWTVVQPVGQTIRKIHSGLPSLIIDMLNDITNDDCLGIMFENEAHQTIWDEVAKENEFMAIQKEATKAMLTDGDGAFKISIDPSLSLLPIIEFKSGESVEYKYERGRLQAIIFNTIYTQKDKVYKFVETYSKGLITNKLYNDQEVEVDFNLIPELEGIEPEVNHLGDYIMAVPFMINKHPKYEHRGKGLLETKFDLFDALDETISQWLDGIRIGRVKEFIPDSLIPRDTEGNKMPLNPITNQFYTYNTMRVNEQDSKSPKPEVSQAIIDANSYLMSYIQYLDMCLMGIISPSTLGIDVKKLDNGEAQREKEKATLYTRNKIITSLETTIPALVKAVMMTIDNISSITPGEYEPTIEFGEYANPSFEAVIETVGKAKSYKIMSTEESVEQIYGDSKSPEDKALEVERIKSENSMSIGGEGSFGGMDNFFEEDENEDKKPKPNEDEKVE